MLNHHSGKCSSHMQCGSVNTMFSVAEEKDSRCLTAILHYFLSLKSIARKHTAYHINNSGHMRINQQPEKSLKITFASFPGEATRSKKKNCNSDCETLCVTRKREKTRMSIAKILRFTLVQKNQNCKNTCNAKLHISFQLY